MFSAEASKSNTKPLGTRKIYLDVAGYRDIKKLETDLTLLGAVSIVLHVLLLPEKNACIAHSL